MVTYIPLFPTEKNLKALRKNEDSIRSLRSGKTEREIVEDLLPTKRHLRGGNCIIEKFLDALDEHTERLFLYLEDQIAPNTGNLVWQHFPMN